MLPGQYFSLRQLGPLLGRRRTTLELLEQPQDVLWVHSLLAAHQEPLYFLVGHNRYFDLSIGQSAMHTSAASCSHFIWEASALNGMAGAIPIAAIDVREDGGKRLQELSTRLTSRSYTLL